MLNTKNVLKGLVLSSVVAFSQIADLGTLQFTDTVQNAHPLIDNFRSDTISRYHRDCRHNLVLSIIYCLTACYIDQLKYYASSIQRRQAGQLVAQDQRMDLVCSLVGVHRFEVGQMTHALVFPADTVCAQDCPRRSGDLQ